MRGFINVIKPEGMNSSVAVAIVKRKFKVPCGHMGTLDPMASGVLPIGLGKTSRLFQYLLDKVKTYRTRVIFGYSTDTLDITGKKDGETGIVPKIEDIEKVLPKFIGEIEQMPPKFSAKCIDGKRGYELARSGIDFELKPKKVTILDIKLVGKTAENEYEFTIDCKGGTYIRSIARDLGLALNTLGVMSYLKRERCGIFDLTNGVTIEDLKASENPIEFVIPSDSAVSFEKIELDDKTANKILNGLYEDIGVKDGTYRVYNGKEFWGVGEALNGILKIKSYVKE